MQIDVQSFRQRQVRHKGNWQLLAMLFVLTSLVIGSSTSVSAQTQPQQTYWLGRAVGTEYVFDLQLPAEFGAMITASGSKYAAVKSLPKFSTETVDGETYNFVTTGVSWDLDLIDNGQIAFHNNGAVQGNWWFNMDKNDAEWKAIVPELKNRATVNGTWKRLTLFVLISEDTAAPTVSVPIPATTLARSRMYEIGQQTVAGQYFPTVKVPADLDAYREQMLAYGNAGRQDPDFRKDNGSTTATDLTLNKVVTLGPVPEQVFRQSDTPPFFTDHVLNDELNQAAQFQAEYNASIDQATHDGPQAWLDPATGKTVNLFDFGPRVEYFGGSSAVEAAGAAGLGDAPHNWMKSDTHFRPWFNVDGCYPEVGYGAAQAANGKWYFVAVPRRLNPCVDPTPQPTAAPTAQATANATADATDQPAAAATVGPTVGPTVEPTVEPTAAATAEPAATEAVSTAAATPNSTPQPSTASASGLLLPADTTIVHGEKYPSESGNHYLIFQPDGNLVVYDAADQYVWGLESQTDNYAQATNVQMQPDGNLVVSGDNDVFIWSALSADPDASATLNLTPEGALQLVSGDTGAVLWASDGNLDVVIPTAAPTTAAVTDADGNVYETVQIGQQLWMAQNLRAATCSDGSAILFVDDQDEWITQTDAAYTWGSDIAGDAQAEEEYGASYNGYAALLPCNVCPSGWRVPSTADFQTLVESQGSDAHLKLSDPDFWGMDSLATNASGWSARPAGGEGGDAPGSYDFGAYAYFWSTTEIDEETNSLFVIHAADASANGLAGLRYGFSIRCVQDVPLVESTSVANEPTIQYPIVITHTAIVDSVAWSPDGSKLASGDRDDILNVWDATTGTSVLASTGHTRDVVRVAWSPDGTKLASVSDDYSARVWDAETGADLLVLTGHTGRLDSVAWSPDGSKLVSASPIDESVRVWDAVTGTGLLTFTLPSASNVTSVAWSPDGSQLASTTNDETILVWDAETGAELLTLTGHTGTPASMAWSPDGSKLASAGFDKTIQVWDAATGASLLNLTDHTEAVLDVAWSPDGSQLASAGSDDTVRVWDAETGALLQTLAVDLASMSGGAGVAWSPDGSKLASATWDGDVLVWDAATGATLHTFTGHAREVLQMAWSPDGTKLATASGDETVRVWDVEAE